MLLKKINYGKVKKNFAISFLMMMFLMILAPINAYADGGGTGINDVDITVGEDGKISIGGMGDYANSGEAWSNIISKYKGFIVGISGIGTVSMILFFIIQFCKLSSTTGNPQARSQCISGLVWSGIATAGLGSVTLLVSLFLNSL